MAGTVSATIDQSGGRLANQPGVVLEVPKNVLTAPATASITPEPDGAWDVHIAATWSGTVAVTLPTGRDADHALLGHQVNGVWRVESAKASHGVITASVRSLSWFKVLGCLIGTPNAGRIARCMIDAGIKSLALKTLTKGLAKKLLDIFAPQCVDVTGGIIDFEKQKIFGVAPSECTAVDGPPSSGGTGGPGTGSGNQPPPGQPAQPPVTSAPAATPSSSSSGQQAYWHHVYHTCANGKCGLRLHTGPGYSGYAVTRVLVDGDAVGIVCQAHGEPVSGIDGSSSDVWDRLIEGDWAADFYVDTPGTTGSFSPPIPVC